MMKGYFLDFTGLYPGDVVVTEGLNVHSPGEVRA